MASTNRTVLRNNGDRAAKVIANSQGRNGQMRILIIDIETLPNSGYMWGMFDQSFGLSQVIEWSTVASFAAKWYGKKKVTFRSVFHDGKDAMLQEAWDMICEADAIVHYNGRAFDIKHLKREFLLAGMGPPSPHKDIDLLTIVRNQFKFTSNKLDNVSTQLGVGSKVKHDGFEMWVGCMQNDPAAWNKMRKYNIGDITITEAVYEIVRPWYTGHPHVGLYTGDIDGCPKCGSISAMRRGYAYTPSQVYQRWCCNNCGGWYRSKTRIPDTVTNTRNVN
tara:strand:+ start:4375 stop:5205 length:831 start_codon:yes stop_codon:yes gene_type:complete